VEKRPDQVGEKAVPEDLGALEAADQVAE